jgi:DnaK suppressor protein
MDEEAPLRSAAPDLAVGEVLEAHRLRLLSLCQQLHHDLESIAEASVSSNADDEHDPEGATIAYERAQVAALLAQSRSRLEEVDRALRRHEQGTYGSCEKCGETIPSERLSARPAARTCLRCAP